ncbi:Mov34/MPN/PAD-1 family protein [Erythrobacter sp. JK5]|uniref:Mov34/MPN/PAD-1 family protein n=1 Tax=Erythrobacter sp. JK5 TaxID=2829500 RepID=UPI001BA76205|nr:M67 family metallopeptidase [Erythrobacter sp. JK5]QUL36653.1 M67 family metallopeptidase [Erythrobacter sp. JK5]
MCIEVTSEVVEAMRQWVLDAHPNEACGILQGKGMRVTGLIETRNVHPDPATHFEIDPQALIDAHRSERAGGLCVLGYFHSHPGGDPVPSATDRALAAGDGRLWAIIAGDELAFWQDRREGFRALSYALCGH